MHIFMSMEKEAYYKIIGYVLMGKLLRAGRIQEFDPHGDRKGDFPVFFFGVCVFYLLQ